MAKLLWCQNEARDKSDRERQILYDSTLMWNLKNTTNEWQEQKRNRLTDRERKKKNSGYQRGKEKGKGKDNGRELRGMKYYIQNK